MDIAKAKQQIKDTIEAYLACDESGELLVPPHKQRPLFLVGAPGIGKTAIVAQVAAELGLGLVSYSMTHHTRQSALGLPYIVKETYGDFEYEASEYTMSEIVASVYGYMREHGVQRGILFLDEINCVSETLYPSMLQFLQFKTFGRHKIPSGWLVVTAGNPPEYNKSVHEFDIVTLDRLKRILVEPDYEAWKKYASEQGIHPAILTFLDIKKDRFYRIEATLDGKSFVTARGWDDLSDMVKTFELIGKTVDYDLVAQYVQNDQIAREFALYYELFNKYREDYRIEDILSGNASEAVVIRAKEAHFDERLSLVALLLDALCSDMRAVNARSRVVLGVRDALRQVKQRMEQSGASACDALEDVRTDIRAQLDLGIAAGTITARGRKDKEDVIADLTACAFAASAPSVSPEEAFGAASDCYAGMPVALAARVERIERRLACTFSFLEEVFGDKQELLVFVTELTSRTDAATYIAQNGSESYYAHNANMIMSDRQRDLRRRVEELNR